MSDINQAGLGRGLQFELFRPGQVAVKDYYAELPISLKVAGRYHDIGSFAADIANLSRIVTLHNLNITTPKDSTGVLSMEATARTYRYLDANEIEEIRRAAAAAKAKAAGQAGREASHELASASRSSTSSMLAGCLGLAACAGDEDELTQWMEQQKREVKPSVEPLSAPKKFNPQAYMALGPVEPFSTQKLAVALKQEARQPNSLLAAEINRRKEPLEAYPVDSMAMVGSVVRGGRPYALLKVDNLLYQVKPGDYLGQNYGKITQISETNVAYREIVQDAAGEWIERNSALQLQEKAR